MQQSAELLNAGVYQTITPEKSTTVKELLKELKLEGMCFGVLVNGKKATLETKISEKDEVVILPKIAGGSLPDQIFYAHQLTLNNEELCPSVESFICFERDSEVVVVKSTIRFFSYRSFERVKLACQSKKNCFLIVHYVEHGIIRVASLKVRINFLSVIRKEKRKINGFDETTYLFRAGFKGKELNIPKNWNNKCFDCEDWLSLFGVVHGCLNKGFSIDEAEKLLQSNAVRFLCCSCYKRRVVKEAKIIA